MTRACVEESEAAATPAELMQKLIDAGMPEGSHARNSLVVVLSKVDRMEEAMALVADMESASSGTL